MKMDDAIFFNIILNIEKYYSIWSWEAKGFFLSVFFSLHRATGDSAALWNERIKRWFYATPRAKVSGIASKKKKKKKKKLCSLLRLHGNISPRTWGRRERRGSDPGCDTRRWRRPQTALRTSVWRDLSGGDTHLRVMCGLFQVIHSRGSDMFLSALKNKIDEFYWVFL